MQWTGERPVGDSVLAPGEYCGVLQPDHRLLSVLSQSASLYLDDRPQTHASSHIVRLHQIRCGILLHKWCH